MEAFPFFCLVSIFAISSGFGEELPPLLEIGRKALVLLLSNPSPGRSVSGLSITTVS